MAYIEQKPRKNALSLPNSGQLVRILSQRKLSEPRIQPFPSRNFLLPGENFQKPPFFACRFLLPLKNSISKELPGRTETLQRARGQRRGDSPSRRARPHCVDGGRRRMTIGDRGPMSRGQRRRSRTTQQKGRNERRAEATCSASSGRCRRCHPEDERRTEATCFSRCAFRPTEMKAEANEGTYEMWPRKSLVRLC